MRHLLVIVLAACSVPDKQPATDAGADAPGEPDGDAPETTITAAPDAISRQGAATFQFESDDATATFECRIDGETPVSCTPPYTRTLGDGSHGFVVRAIDAAGNGDDTPAEHVWLIDTVAPDTRLTKTPPRADNSVFVTFEFESNEDNVMFDCSLDAASYIACESGGKVGPIGDGAHSFAVRARDRAGNVDTSPPVYAWVVDTSTPDTQILSGPNDATGSTSASFTFLSPDAGPGATFQCALDGAAFVACTSPRTVAGLSAGQHTFAVRVRDAVGNFDPTPATRVWTVDLTPPNTTITGGPIGVVPSASASFTFTSNEQGVRFECRVDTTPFAACASPHNLMSLAQGPHGFQVRAIDAAGHMDATPATRTWTVDTIAPDVTITSGPGEGETSGPRVAFTFTSSDGVVTCSLDSAAFTACASPLELSLPAGSHELRVRASDGAGNVSTATRTWTVACGAPSTAGAAGLLHLDDPDQIVVNAASGANATLGDDETVELADPTPIAGRFGGALAFTSLEGDHVSWPAALGATSAMTIELWARPDAMAGLRVILASGDGRVTVRVAAVSPTLVRFSIAISETDGLTRIATSAAVAAGEWHHVLASLQEPTLRLWVDGARTETDVRPGTPPMLDAIRIGGAAVAPYSGAIDELWVAQTAIIADEAALARYCPL
jgi:hypothetical protein